MSRYETDSLGKVKIPKHALWGAQTQRSLKNFEIGADVFPFIFIKNYAILKKAAAHANFRVGKLDESKAALIQKVCDEIIEGKHRDQFPLKVWQTGSGTQTNMNLNEVIANRASLLDGKGIDIGIENRVLHPNDDVNMSQSSNDTFPTVMQMSAVEAFESAISKMMSLADGLEHKAQEFHEKVKIGRTHLMDAVPMRVGQEFGAWASQLKHGIAHVQESARELYRLPIGGTAIGTGLNASDEFTKEVLSSINSLTGRCGKSGSEFLSCENKFSKIAAHDDLAVFSAAFKSFAISLMKVANDIRLLGSGPRCGLGELILPANEPGSSIMPGKVNPTQCEAITMVCAQVIGNDVAISFGASHGQFQLNAYKPLIIHNLLHSIELIGSSCHSFEKHCVEGIALNEARLKELMESSLMIVTALTPVLGYEKCSKIAQKAYQNGTNIREEVLAEDLMSAARFDSLVNPEKML